MGKRENDIEIAQNYLNRARNKLESAEILLREGKFDDSISRSYYAVFLSAKSVLLLLGENPRSHSGLLTLFGLRIIKTGIAEKKFAKIITSLFEARQTSDYLPLVWYEASEASDFYDKASEFVEMMKSILQKLMK